MEAHYAVVNSDGLVVNTVVWDGTSAYEPGDGLTLVPLPFTLDEDGVRRYTGGIGWDWDSTGFVDNRPEPSDG